MFEQNLWGNYAATYFWSATRQSTLGLTRHWLCNYKHRLYNTYMCIYYLVFINFMTAEREGAILVAKGTLNITATSAKWKRNT